MNRKKDRSEKAAKHEWSDLMRVPAQWIVNRFSLHRADGSGRQLNEDIRALSGGRKESAWEYHVRKWSQILTLALLVTVLAVILLVKELTTQQTVENGALERPSYGSASREELLVADIEGADQKEEIELKVESRQYSAAQAEEFLDQAQEELEAYMLAENPSKDEVRDALYLPQTLSDGKVQAEWSFVPYGVISEDGSLTGQTNGKVGDEGVLVNISAQLTCQDVTREYACAVKVLPRLLTEEEALKQTVDRAVEAVNESSAQEEYLVLPDSVEGRQISWSYQREGQVVLVILLLLLSPVLLGMLQDSNVREKAAGRRSEMLADYPELLWKMTMLLGAGLTIGGTFRKIVQGYQKESQTGKKRYVYEEMLYTCREMKSGVPEAKAYENFGRRCALPVYIKLGTLLSQNLKKGSIGLAALLEQEALSASEERRNEARKQGERAGTKMLLPMVLMLVVVLVILIVPAFLNM